MIIREKEIPVLTQLVRAVVSIVRGVPPLTQLFVFYYGLPKVLEVFGININDWSPVFFVVAAYSLGQSATVMENLRSAFSSVGLGQREAAYSIGMTTSMAFIRIIIPQALTVALPNFSNLCVATLKNTSIAFSVGVIELVARANQLSGAMQHKLESYVSLAIIYYILYLAITTGFKYLEKKISFVKY
ncbi:MAG: amino acid ABC transporter permease [Lachnospiraceae bacterium]|nr:amino acid ABC transporter permease [Lachnospiraceae bacterium]